VTSYLKASEYVREKMLVERSSTEVLFGQVHKNRENQAKTSMDVCALHRGARADTIEF
jgi:hypothetical protein